jgi:hypothetical protein
MNFERVSCPNRMVQKKIGNDNSRLTEFSIFTLIGLVYPVPLVSWLFSFRDPLLSEGSERQSRV